MAGGVVYPSAFHVRNVRPAVHEERGGEEPLLDRPGNHVKTGIVGLPNMGESPFLNLMCKLSVPEENHPFCTSTGPSFQYQLTPSQWSACHGSLCMAV